MTQPTKADALIARIDAETEAELARIRAEAEADAAELVRAAHMRARRRVHQEIQGLRHLRAEALRHETARLDTARRQMRQREATAAIARGLPEVTAALTRLWDAKETRTLWVNAVLERAAARLPHDGWVIEHPEKWTASEQKRAKETCATLTGSAPGFEPLPDLAAGLRVRAGGACLDGSLAAVTGDRDALSAALLAVLARGKEALT